MSADTGTTSSRRAACSSRRSRSSAPKQVDLVPRLDARRCPLFRHSERLQHIFDVVGLGVAVGVSHVADVDEQIGRTHLLERRPECRDQFCRQIRHESDGVRKDHLVETGQVNVAHRRVESCEHKVLREHSFTGQPIEKGRLSGVGVADKSNYRPRRALPPVAVQRARPLDLLELPPNPRHAIADHPAIGLDLGFARAAKEAEAAALAFEVGPAAHQPAGLIVEMGKLDLQPPLGSRGAFAEDLQDQARPVDDLDARFLLQVLLLNGGKRRIDDEQLGAILLGDPGDLLDLPLAEQGRRADGSNPECAGADHIDADRTGEAIGLLDPRLGGAARRFASELRYHDDRPLTAGHLDCAIAVEVAHSVSCCSPSSSFSACSG